MKTEAPTRGAEATATGASLPTAGDAVEEAFKQAMAQWRAHLERCDGRARPRLAPDHWGRP